VPPNGLTSTFEVQNSRVNRGSETAHPPHELLARERPETTVLVAVESPQVREALVAMLGAIDGFRVVAEADTDEAALEAARRRRPRLALIEPELSDCGGWWVIQQIRADQLACVVVALGRRANGAFARLAGAQSYVQMGISPRDLLNALESAVAHRRHALSSSTETEQHLLPNANSVIEKPALIDF
jgi:DNA-binding NarL/FixJ family response regulator